MKSLSMLSITVPHLLARCEEALFSAEGLLAAAKSSVADMVSVDGKISPSALDREQRATHGLAWLATYVEALRQMARWGRSLEQAKKFGDIEQLTDSLRHYSWTALAELKGDAQVLRKLDEAEKLLKDLKKALGK